MLHRASFSSVALATFLIAVAGASACGGDDEPAGTGGATTGAGGSGGEPTGTGGSGGISCGDIQTDLNNCGACGHRCAPGQTCEAGACVCGQDMATFAADVQPILTASCALALCHAGAMPKAGLDLTVGSAHVALTTGSSVNCMSTPALVLPGNPSDSYVIRKMLGSELCFGGRMPPAMALPQDSIKAISDWICGGAQDN
jgi:hypothetical protein